MKLRRLVVDALGLVVAPHRGAWVETSSPATPGWWSCRVAPHRGAWVETTSYTPPNTTGRVAPHRGAWVETKGDNREWSAWRVSRPIGARGLKRAARADGRRPARVAPHRGAWVETSGAPLPGAPSGVAPHRGAWVETSPSSGRRSRRRASRPIGARGLKLEVRHRENRLLQVAPHRGAWVETTRPWPRAPTRGSRAP